MAIFTAGDIVIGNLPFTDLSGSKYRPLLVIGAPEIGRGIEDVIVCLITRSSWRDNYDVPIDKGDFVSGGLKEASTARPCHLFSIDPSVLRGVVGRITPAKLKEARDKAVKAITGK